MSPVGLRLSLILGVIAFALDRVHKYVQVELMAWPAGSFRPVTSFFDIGLVFNTGISYGLLGSMPLWAIAILVATALIALTVWWARANSTILRAGLALCIGGALSNALDRGIYGAVADFFLLHWGSWSFYIFNIADASISLGVLLLILDFLGIGRAPATKPA